MRPDLRHTEAILRLPGLVAARAASTAVPTELLKL
jgi:hypothetical protein